MFREIARYAQAGIVCTIVGFGIILICHEALGLGVVISNAIGYGTGFVISFFLNARWTFSYSHGLLGRVLPFCSVVAFSFIANLGVIEIMLCAGVPFWGAQTCGVTAYSSLLFLGSRVIFKRSSDRVAND